jgi:hypothetical protein
MGLAGPASPLARADEILAVTRAWLGIGDDGKTRQLAALAPVLVLQALHAGDRVRWAGWTLKTLPPRRFGLGLQVPEPAAGILALSAHGMLSELRVDTECVRRICQRMQDMENRHARACKAEAQEAGCQESELEDG